MELGGVTEVAVALGMSKQRVAAIRTRPSFPQPEAQLAQGPVWDLEKIRRWAGTGRQPRGRPHTLAIRRRFGNRYELESLPDPSRLFNRATDLVALASGQTCTAVAVHVVPRPSSPEAVNAINARLDLLAGAPHPHVQPILDHGLEGGEQPYFVTPLPVRRLSRVLADRAGEDPGAVEVLKQVAHGALHLVRLSGGIGFSLHSATLVQGTSSAWCLIDLRPDWGPPSTEHLVTELRGLVGALGSSRRAYEDGVLHKSLQWLDTRLTKRVRTLRPEKLLELLLDDLDQVAGLLSHRHVARRFDSVPQWVLDAIRQGVTDTDLLHLALGPLVSDRKGHMGEEAAAMPLDEAKRILPTLSPSQLSSIWRADPELLREAVSAWCGDLGDATDLAGNCQGAVEFLLRLMGFDDDSLLLTCVLGLVAMACRSPEWHCRSVLIALLQNARESRKITTVTEALSLSDPDELRKALSGTDPDWFPPKVREIVEKVLADAPNVIDLTTARAGAPRRASHAAGR